MSLILMLLLQASGDIVITGKRLEEAHAACVRGECTPLRDAQASIALAESRFRNGDYLKAKGLLARAVSRNKNKAATDPKPVAALYEAYATVALHEGDQDNYRRAVAHQVNTLRDHVPHDDPAVLAATTALGDMWLKVRDGLQADRTYRTAEREALEAGNEQAAMLAGMKRAWLSGAMDQPKQAYAKLDELEQRPIAKQPGFATALRVLRLRLAARDAEGAELSKLVASLGQSQGAVPVLLKAPAYELDAAAARSDADALNRRLGDFSQQGLRPRSSDLDPIQWADIGFWIRPNGSTADAEVLRSSNGNPWTALVLRQVAQRRYSTSAVEGDGYYKVERLTRRSKYIVPTDSLIKRRTAIGGFETLDLTEEGPAPPPKTTS